MGNPTDIYTDGEKVYFVKQVVYTPGSWAVYEQRIGSPNRYRLHVTQRREQAVSYLDRLAVRRKLKRYVEEEDNR